MKPIHSVLHGAVRAFKKLGALAAKRSVVMLPKPLRHAYYRHWIRLNPEAPAPLSFGIAQTREELDAAFRILHDAYVGMGYMDPDPSGMRVTAYHALPTTHTLIARWDGQVVATVSVIQDGELGIPADKIFDLAALRKRRRRIVEISALAIRQDFRGNQGEVLFPLLKFLYEICERHLRCEQLVIATHPCWADFYEAIFAFEPLGSAAVENYAFVNGAPAQGLFLDLRNARARWFERYAGKPDRQNVFRYLCPESGRAIGSVEPARSWRPDQGMAPELLHHFFARRSDVFASLSAEEQVKLGRVVGRHGLAGATS